MLVVSALVVLGFVPAPIAGLASLTPGFSNRGVPIGRPIGGAYGGPLRPQVHFSPPQGFMNDPNGMFVEADGTYHLYYQYNPLATSSGNQHWGHATSRDLYHWTNHPIALYPGNSSEGIFSGCAVIDSENTSGFFPNQTNGVVAIYTINNPYQQSQSLAYSSDNGYTFTKYAGNPVLSEGSVSFRDPKVFWHSPQRQWVMVVAYSQDFTLGIFTSPNLINWTHASNFSNHGLLGNQWECPNLVEMPMEGSASPVWLLYLSINPGAPLGGSIGQYYPGKFNGTHFTPVDGVARIADFGKDNYAGQFFHGIPGDQPQVAIHWAANWQYCNFMPTGPLEGWQSAMTVPRKTSLKKTGRAGYALVSQPYGLDAVMGAEPLSSQENLGNGILSVEFSGEGSSGAVLLSINITNVRTAAFSNSASANFTIFSSVSGESLSAGVFLSGGDATFWMDRGNTHGFINPHFTDKASVAMDLADAWSGQMLVDRSLWEVFLNGGEKSATMTFFPEFMLDTLVVKTGGLNEGCVVSVGVWELESGWIMGAGGRNRTERVKRDDGGGGAVVS